MGPLVDGPATGVLNDKEGLLGVEEEGSGFWDVTEGIWGLSPVCRACCLPLHNFLDGRESEVINDSAGVTKVYYGRVWLPYLIVESLSSRLQGVTHRKASCISEAKHVPLYAPKVSMVMIVIYLWCHWYVIQYWDHVFHHMHISDIYLSTRSDWNEGRFLLTTPFDGHFIHTMFSGPLFGDHLRKGIEKGNVHHGKSVIIDVTIVV